MELFEKRTWVLVIFFATAVTVGPTMFQESNADATKKIDMKHQLTDAAKAPTVFEGSLVRKKVIPPEKSFEDRLLNMLKKTTGEECGEDLETFVKSLTYSEKGSSLSEECNYCFSSDSTELSLLCCRDSKCAPPTDPSCGSVFCSWLQDEIWYGRHNAETAFQNKKSGSLRSHMYDWQIDETLRYWLTQHLNCPVSSGSLKCDSSHIENGLPLTPAAIFSHPGLRNAIIQTPRMLSFYHQWAYSERVDSEQSDTSVFFPSDNTTMSLDRLFDEIEGHREYDQLFTKWIADGCSVIPPGIADELRIHTLVFNIADPSQSGVGVYFDQALESIVTAAASAGFVKDLFWIPWLPSTESNSPSKNIPDNAHESPGIMLFRSEKSSDPDRPFDDLLVVFLVQESPVLGPNVKALRQAMDTADKIASAPKTPLCIIGPFFSGSASKLASAIRQHRMKKLCRPIEVISGTATGASVPDVFKNAEIVFYRTVYSDESLIEYLKSEICEHQPETRFALLTELGTGYGQRVVAQEDVNENDEDDDNNCNKAKDPQECCARRKLRPYQFPFHISDLRALREQSRDTGASQNIPTLRQTLELKLSDEGETFTDIPALSSRLTHYDIELSLRQTIQRICRRDVPTYVVTAATNIKDVIFLSDEIRKYCPRVGLATVNGDLLLTHTDMDATMSGMVVASTYPLTPKNREFFRDGDPQYAFPGYASAGLYNAVVASLGKMMPGTPDRFYGYEPLYQWDKKSAPKRWLTMIASGRYWPIASEFGKFEDNDSSIYRTARKPTCIQPVDALPPHNLPPRGSNKFILAAIFFLIALFIHLCFAFGFKHGRWSWYGHRSTEPKNVRAFLKALFWTGDGPIKRQADRALYRTATFLAFTCLAWLAFPAAKYRVDSTIWFFSLTAAIVVTVACVPAILSAFYKIGQLFILAGKIVKKSPEKSGCRIAPLVVPAVRIIAIVVILYIIKFSAMLFLEWRNGLLVDNNDRWMLRSRILEPGGMSPLGPLLYLADGLYLWGIFGLRRIWAQERFPSSAPIQKADGEYGLLSAMNRLRKISNGNHCWIDLIVAVAVIFHYVIIIRPALFATFEGETYDRLLWFGIFLLYCAATVHFVRFAYGIRYLILLLRRIVSLPMADACDRLAIKVSRGFGTRLGARVPEPLELTLSTQNIGTLIGLVNKIRCDGSPIFATPLKKQLEDLEQIHEDLQKYSKQIGESEQGRSPKTFPHELTRKVHTSYFRASDILFGTLLDIWKLRSDMPKTNILKERDTLLPKGSRAGLPTAAYLMGELPDDVYLWMRTAEDSVMMRIVTFILQQLSLLRNQLVYAWLGAFLIVTAVRSYPIQPSPLIMLFAMFIVGTVIIGSIVTMVLLEKNPVLRRLSGTDTGSFAFKASFIGRLLLFVALPATVMLANVYPELGAFLFSCLKPLEYMMP